MLLVGFAYVTGNPGRYRLTACSDQEVAADAPVPTAAVAQETIETLSEVEKDKATGVCTLRWSLGGLHDGLAVGEPSLESFVAMFGRVC